MAVVNGPAHADSVTPVPDAQVSDIVGALELIHAPRSSNDERFQAMIYLEKLKQHHDLAQMGYALAGDTDQQAVVRHFGLSLLEHTVRHRHRLSSEQSHHLRNLIISLAQTLVVTTQSFLRNKIAGLWVELAKRTWALDWYNLDEYLFQLWSQDDVGKEFVLFFLENLSDDIFVREDHAAVIRERDLNNAVVEIFTSAIHYPGTFKVKGSRQPLRYDDQGWIARIAHFLKTSFQNRSLSADDKKLCLSALATLRSVSTWVMIPSIVHADFLPVVCSFLAHDDSTVTVAVADVLLALYARPRLEEAEVQALVYPLCQEESVHALRQVYSRSIVEIDEIQSQRYTISKKIAELVHHLSGWLILYKPPGDMDVTAFMKSTLR